jgi:hypothetical protein
LFDKATGRPSAKSLEARFSEAIGGGVESTHGRSHGEDPQVARARQEVLAAPGSRGEARRNGPR